MNGLHSAYSAVLIEGSPLIGLVTSQQAEAEAAAAALKDPPMIPAGGWLLIGRVREADGRPPKGGQISFEGGDDITARLLPPIAIPADGRVRITLDAQAVAEITRQGEVTQAQVTAKVGARSIMDVAPALIAAGGVHQFDLILPAPKAERPAQTRV